MTTLACTRTGAGPPLVLLHGIGCSRRRAEVAALSRRLAGRQVTARAEHANFGEAQMVRSRELHADKSPFQTTGEMRRQQYGPQGRNHDVVGKPEHIGWISQVRHLRQVRVV